ncbi:MAG: dipeptide/oligopeptide/nickel ABC transporter permease/ATP-binding protein [Actinomycetales bacterium]|nr:dipeptide/oligopeptide/nickel ABC transporter permease/ATP-binding protein [Actinomycetales bacterium]
MSRKKFALPFYLRKPTAIFSMVWLAALTIGSVTAPLWEPFNPLTQTAGDELLFPSLKHLLGTDDLGRDMFSRILASSAFTFYASIFTVVVAFAVGVPLALWAAERRGRVESTIGRFVDTIFALPGTVMILALIGTIGTAVEPVMTFFGLLVAPGIYRIMVAQTISVRQRLYVDATRLNGLGSVRINFKHVLPALYRFLAVQVAMVFSVSLLMQAGLSFLGLGPQEPQPSWGGMISQATMHIYDFPWMMVPPGIVLVLTVLAANELADVIGAGDLSMAKPRTVLARSILNLKKNVVPSNSTPDASALLDVRDLRVGVAGGPELVSGISLKLAPGKVLGLVGESGCGKTMSALSIMGLLPAGVGVTQGSIFWQGKDIASLSEKQLNALRGSGMAYISQEPMVALDPMFTVQAQLVEPLRRLRKVSKREAKQIALSLLVQVGIPAPERVIKSYPHQLSGGMAQRVAIALALTGKPKLLIADEPTTALDVTIQAEILELLRGLVATENMAMVIVTHNLGVVADIADDVAVMYAGQVVESGTVDEVLTHPSHPYTSALLGADPHVPTSVPKPERLASIPGTVPAPTAWTSSCRFADRCDFATAACGEPLNESAAHANGTVRCVRSNELTLTIGQH